MRFCDKLPKLRKENNITQEQLADRLGVSRQAISKWESGLSIPDMEKMMQLCNILNCTLEDLLDDGVISEGKPENTKTNLVSYFQDFLKYISKVYNMFCSMKLKEILKCLFEMLLVLGILYFFGIIIYNFFSQFFFDLLSHIPLIGEFLVTLLKNIVLIALVILVLTIFFHLFKIRYLDYYIIIEDKNATEKVIETPIDTAPQTEKELMTPKPKEKIIIRDPKHSTFSFFEFLSKVFTWVLKVFFLFILGMILIFFLLSIISFFIAILHISYNIFFLYLSLAILGIILFTYIFIELIYDFVISHKQHFKRAFIIGLIGLILLGIGIGGAITTYLNFQEYDIESKGTTQKIKVEMEPNLIIEENNYNMMNFDYIIDDTKEDLEIEVKSYGDFKINPNEYIEHINGVDYINCTLFFDRSVINLYKLVVTNIKEETRLPFLEEEDFNYTYSYKVKITLSSQNYQKLKDNYKKYRKDLALAMESE